MAGEDDDEVARGAMYVRIAGATAEELGEIVPSPVQAETSGEADVEDDVPAGAERVSLD
jgi:hypothetical protein